MLPDNYVGILTSGYSPYFHPRLSPRPRDSVFGPNYLESASYLLAISLRFPPFATACPAFGNLTVQQPLPFDRLAYCG